ncbi:hypothetical protein [Sulfurovum xiamenensis]|uniref:hypothetical protein n=1 Tax=Sulfurovum xiamenensis TaxID=3019066 RepID=UPI0033394578
MNRLTCATLEGVNAQVIEVEATFKGVPGFTVVGLASSDIQEAKERTKYKLLVSVYWAFPCVHIYKTYRYRKNHDQFESFGSKEVGYTLGSGYGIAYCHA